MRNALPPNWASAQLAELSLNVQTRQPRDDEVFTYIDISSIDRHKKLITDAQSMIGRDAPSRARQVVHTGDVLVSMTRPNLNAVALVPDQLDNQIASTGFHVLRPRLVNSRWLYYFVRTDQFVAAMSSLVQGALYPAIRPRDIRTFEIPIAPLTEQARIVAKLDTCFALIDAIRERLQNAAHLLHAFRQAILAAATDGRLTEEWREQRGQSSQATTFDYNDAESFRPYSFPGAWQQARLSDVAQITGGITRDAKKQNPEFEEVPYLRVANVQRGYLDLEDIRTIRVPRDKLSELLLREGDILFNEGGDIDKLGRGWVWSAELDRCVFQNHVFRARLRDQTFSPKFFSWYGNTRAFNYFLSNGRQTTNLASINRRILSALPVVLPSAEEQFEIVTMVEEFFRYADSVEEHLMLAKAKTDALPSSILEKAFRGKLVDQDPTDEPAELLLRRLTEDALPPASVRPARIPNIVVPSKVEVQMLKRSEIESVHLSSILRQYGTMSPEDLFELAQLEIDDFYEQLRDEEAAGLLRELRIEDGASSRQLEAVG